MNFWSSFALLIALTQNAEETSADVWDNSHIEISETEINVTTSFSRLPKVDYDLIFECISSWCPRRKTQPIQLSYTYIANRNYTTFEPKETFLSYTEYIPRIYLNKTILQKEYPTIRTNPGRPGKVRNLLVYCRTDGELGVKWQPPDPPTGTISNYSIKLNGKNKKEIIWKNSTCITIIQLKANTEYNIQVRARNEGVQDLGEATSVTNSTTEKSADFLNRLDFEYLPKNSSILFTWRHSFRSYCKPRQIKIIIDEQVFDNVASEERGYVETPLATSPHMSNISVVVKNFAEEEHAARAKIIKVAELENRTMENAFISYICDETCKFKISTQLMPYQNAVLLLLLKDVSLDSVSRDYFDFETSNSIQRRYSAKLNVSEKYATAETSETDFYNISIIHNNTLIYPAAIDKAGLLYYKTVKLSNTTSRPTPSNYETSTGKTTTEMTISGMNEKTHSLTDLFHLMSKVLITTIFLVFFILLVGCIMMSRCIYRKCKRRSNVSEHLPNKIEDEELSYYYPSFDDEYESYLNLNRNETDYPDSLGNRLNQSFRLQRVQESYSDMSDESNSDLGNYYTDMLDRSYIESFSEITDDQESSYYDRFVPELSNIVSTKYFEKYLLELSDTNMVSLTVEYKRIKAVCKSLYMVDSTTNERSSKRSHEDTRPRYLKGYSNPHTFIHIQYPERSHINDFWRMIWSQHIKNVVAVENPSGSHEILKYWPSDEDMFGDILVVNRGLTSIMGNTITKFTLKYGSKTRIVVHYKLIFRLNQNGCIEALTNFMKILSDISETRPIVIMCLDDAIIGTLLLCNIAMKMALCERKVDFMAILFSLGVQKLSFLSGMNNYILAHFLVYDCLYEEKFSIPVDSKFESRIETILTRKSVKPLMEAVTNNFYLYQKIPKFQENFRVTCFPYTNAVEVDCFACSRKFICTPQPEANDIGSFWKLVAESEINTIISLNQLDNANPKHFLFWDTNKIDLTGSAVTLKVFEERDRGSFTTIRVNTIFNRHFKEITILILKAWRRGTFQPPNLQNLMEIWKETFRNIWTHKEKGTILLTCSNGYTACGLFIAMSILLETIDLENACDIYTAVKLVRRFDPHFVQEWGQFDFLHKVALEYSKKFVKPNISEYARK